MNNIWILGQAESNDTPSGISPVPANSEGEATMTVADSNDLQTQTTTPQRSPMMQFLPFILMFVVMYFLLFRGPRKKQQQHKQMVQSLAKNDRVQTIGGIIGTVVDVKADEITLKIDESNNTKIKILRSAIGKNLSKDKD